ncbi:MAG: ABC transporter ATP-binding protein [Bacillota bacterium]
MENIESKIKKKRIDLKLWKDLLVYSLPYKKIIGILACIMIFVAGIDAALPLLTRYAIDNYVIPGDLSGIWVFGLVYLVLITIQSINVFGFIYFAGKLETEMAASIRDKAFARLQELSLSFYNDNPVGWLMARLTSDVHRLAAVISWGVVDLAWGFTMMLAIMGVMLVLNFKLALVALTVVPPLILLSIFFQKKILREFRQVRKINSKITGSFNEGISGAKTSKTLVREERNCEEFAGLTDEMAHFSVRAAIFSSLFLPAVLVLSSIGTGLALWQGGSQVITGALTYGTLVAFISYTIQFFEPVREMARVFAELQSAQAAAERIISLINTEADIKDTKQVMQEYGTVLNPELANTPGIKGEIVFKGVSFSYKNEEKVLQNFNLKVRAGEKIALVGETGSGKSTIVNLICRFYEPITGEIMIDGINYKSRSQSWLQSQIGYVLQDPHLFSGTIAENIRFGKTDATMEEIKQAAQLVQAADFIERLVDGYETEVGEGGDLLSTGEKQLISFARAIIGNPALFVLDEATSSIDTKMEFLIQKTIARVLNNRTSFIIAHRLSTVKNADRILVLSNGKVIEEGSHEQLIKEGGYYYDLYQNQFHDSRREKFKTRVSANVGK